MQVFPHTTNPCVSTGDGMAMAHRAKAVLANMEFVQFHPTSLYQNGSGDGRSFLISEAVRGEGGMLFNRAGQRFMGRYLTFFAQLDVPLTLEHASHIFCIMKR